MSRASSSRATNPPILGKVFWVFSLLSVTVLMVLISTLPAVMKSEKPFISEANLLFYALVVYFSAAVLYVAYAVMHDEAFFQIASRIVWLGFLLHNGAVVLRWMAAGRPPVSNIYEMMISFAWGIVLMHLIIEQGYKFKFAGLFALPMACLVIIMTIILPSDVRPLMPDRAG